LKEIYQVPTSEFDETLAWFWEKLDLAPLLDVPVRQLSLGQKMRCELAAAFLHRPKVVYLDEPTIGLDIEIKETIRHFIREMSDRWGTTVILTTHDMQDIEEVCDRVIVLDDGKIIYDDTIDQLKASFSHERTLRITLEEPVPFALPTVLINRVIMFETDELTYELAFDDRELSSGQVIKEIVSLYAVRDVSVSVPKMETLIRKLYQAGISA